MAADIPTGLSLTPLREEEEIYICYIVKTTDVSVLNVAKSLEDLWGSGGMTPYVINFDSRWR
jgi:hypothetical protein